MNSDAAYSQTLRLNDSPALRTELARIITASGSRPLTPPERAKLLIISVTLNKAAFFSTARLESLALTLEFTHDLAPHDTLRLMMKSLYELQEL